MFKNSEGQKVPSVTFKTLKNHKLTDVTTDDLFAGKKVVLFGLPGAYTPTCSSAHVPRYNELAKQMKKQGVDSIICLSVNDPFVMAQWARDQHAPEITFLADGNGEFVDKLGLLVDKSAIGFGKRSWRFSMFVDNGTVKKMFVEPQKEGDPFEVSDADTLFRWLFPEAKSPRRIAMISRHGCPHCARAKDLLAAREISFVDIPLGPQIPSSALFALSGQKSTPQVFVDGRRIGGADELERYLREDEETPDSCCVG